MERNDPLVQFKGVFEQIEEVQDVLNELKKVKDTTVDCDVKEVKSFVENVKDLVEKLKSKAVEVGELFEERYNRWQSEADDTEVIDDTYERVEQLESSLPENNKENEAAVDSATSTCDSTPDNLADKSPVAKTDNLVGNSKNDNKTSQNIDITLVEFSNDSTKDNNVGEHSLKETAIKETVNVNSDEDDQLKVSDEKSTGDAEQTSAAKESEIENHEVEKPRPFLKCVSLDKLVQPKLLTKAKLLQSPILVISDSDDDVQHVESRRPQRKCKILPKRGFAHSSPKNTKKKEDESSVRSILINSHSKNSSRDLTEPNSPKNNSVKSKSSPGTLMKKVRFDCSNSSLSSLSSSDEETKESRKGKRRNENTKSIKYDQVLDKKFSLEAYVPLPKIPCDKLKDYYTKMEQTNEVNSLANLDSLKKRSRNSSNDENSSSSAEESRTRKRNKPSGKKEENENDGSPSSGDDLEPVEPLEEEPSIHKPVDAEELNDELARSKLRALDSDSDNPIENSNEEEEKPKSKPDDEEEKDKSDSKDKVCEDTEKPEVEKDETKQEELRDKEEDKKKTTEEKDTSDNDKSNDDSEDDGQEQKKEKSGWPKDKPLTAKYTISDSEDEFDKLKKKEDSKTSDGEENKFKPKQKRLKKKAKVAILSDSDSSSYKRSESSSSSTSSSDSSDKEKDDEKVQTRKRRRIKRVQDSSDEGEKNTSTRKQIRKVLKGDSLNESTKQAEKEEMERKARIAERQEKYNKMFEGDKPKERDVLDKLVLDFDEDKKEELLVIHPAIVKHLKPHQGHGIKFMWDACFESIERIGKTTGSGCILAHCMGLGKTLQVISLLYTLLSNEEKTKVSKALVVCPLNTVLNWVSEFYAWLKDVDGHQIEIFELVSYKQNYERHFQIKEWHKNGGVLVLGYDMYRNLSNPTSKRLSKKFRNTFQEALVDPGPDIVICDEGHLLKNEKTNLSISMNRLKTLRRIVLTGTPMQNNLKEYYCMVQFVKPNLLGTFKEYMNRFVNPITNGQYTDSTQHDIDVMRRRSHVLHKLLDGVVQRKDYSVLTPFLPPKYEYVLFIKLSEVQKNLYSYYLENFARKPTNDKIGKTTFLFMDFQEFQRICTHPRVLLHKSMEQKSHDKEESEDSEGSLKDFIDDDDDESSAKSTSSSSDDDDNSGSDKSKKEDKHKTTTKGRTRLTRAKAAAEGLDIDKELEEVKFTADQEGHWWSQFCSGSELDNIEHSSKLRLLFEILQQCEAIGDKVLLFSQSLYSLNIIEYFLAKIDEATQCGDTKRVCGYSGSWSLGLDYYRLDGSSSCDNRAAWCKSFNNPENTRARLFLISTKAGGLGINLVAANRVIIFDVSWNPSHDLQSIYRVYRFGQTKPCYIYRFVTYGAMEMKIYERQVTKQAISKRVIDEQQIDRHYNQNDLAELYNFDPEPENRPIPLVPKDVLLGELLQTHANSIYKYHEHQSLLENKEEEELNEEERKAAWEEFESEKVARQNPASISNIPIHSIIPALASLLKKENPTWTNEHIQSLIPSAIRGLQEEVSLGMMENMYRVTNEMRIQHALNQKRYQEMFAHQQTINFLQQQHQQQQQLFKNMNMNMMNNPGPSVSGVKPKVGNFAPEIIELND